MVIENDVNEVKEKGLTLSLLMDDGSIVECDKFKFLPNGKALIDGKVIDKSKIMMVL